MPRGDLFPPVQATSGNLTGRLGTSQRDVVETLETVFHTELSLGKGASRRKRRQCGSG